jgi:hypothetical protein
MAGGPRHRWSERAGCARRHEPIDVSVSLTARFRILRRQPAAPRDVRLSLRRAALIVSLTAPLACRAVSAPAPANQPDAGRAPTPVAVVSPSTPPLAFEGVPVAIEGLFGRPVSKEVRLVGPRADRVIPTVVRVEGTEVTAAPLAAQSGQPGHTPGIRLTLSGKRAGQGVGNVVVSTGLPDPKELVLYYGWKVPGNLTVTPSNPYLDLRLPGRHVVELSVASSRPDFRLLRARVVAGPFAAHIVSPSSGAARTVEVRVIESGLTDQRGFLGKLMLWSNDPAEPRKEIPLFALGRLGALGSSGAPDP